LPTASRCHWCCMQLVDHMTEAVDAIIHGFSLSVEETQCDRFHHTISTVSF
jgi:hypothetical protein